MLVKTQIKWSRFDRLVREMAKVILSEYAPRTIVGLARGGLPMATMLSHILKKPLVIVSTRSYSGKVRNKLVFEESGLEVVEGPVLIVDEIADSGETLKRTIEHYSRFECRTAVLVCKATSSIVPNYAGMYIRGSEWVVFPWEG